MLKTQQHWNPTFLFFKGPFFDGKIMLFLEKIVIVKLEEFQPWWLRRKHWHIIWVISNLKKVERQCTIPLAILSQFVIWIGTPKPSVTQVFWLSWLIVELNHFFCQTAKPIFDAIFPQQIFFSFEVAKNGKPVRY